MKTYDLVVIGGGAAGLVAAREARRRKASVVIVQDGPIGGDCTFTGCVPSKALLAAAARRDSFAVAMASVRRAVDHIAATEDAPALAKAGIDTIEGRARLRGPHTVVVDGISLTAPQIVIATGARPTIPLVPGLIDIGPLTSDTVFSLSRLPQSLTVIGGGAIGCELSQAFARLGTKVTLVETADRLIFQSEPGASTVLADALRADGVNVIVSAKATTAERRHDGMISLHLDNRTTIESEHILVATGRTPSGKGFGLEEIGVEVDERGAVIVDEAMATRVPGIWAAGDVTGRLQFTHAAGRMGWVAASNALSKLAKVRRFRFSTRVMPNAVFTSPEVARVGLTESEAAVEYSNARVAFLPFTHVDRAVAVGAENGFVKLITAPQPATRHRIGGKIVGATVVGPTAGELIHEAALAMQANLVVGRLAQTSHAYPSWSGAVQQAALQFFGTSAGLTARPAERNPKM